MSSGRLSDPGSAAPDYDRMVKSPSRKRPLPRRVAVGLDPVVLGSCAKRVTYVGSPEHKSYPSFAGPPKLRSDATRCPKHLRDADQITGWLRDAIFKGQVSDDPGEIGYPRYVWAHQEGMWFEARLVNSEQGTDKGYPLARGEEPNGLLPGSAES